MSAPVTANQATAPPIDVSNLFSVKGLVALVTGGGSGMLLSLSSLFSSFFRISHSLSSHSFPFPFSPSPPQNYHQNDANKLTGIGLMLTQSLASAGAKRVYIAGRRLPVLQSAADRVNSSLPQSSSTSEPVVVPLECDVTSPSSLASVVSHISSDPYTGYLNLLLCNAGVGGPQVSAVNKESGEPKSLKQFREENLAVDFDKEWEATFKVNVGSVWYTSMACLELLEKGNTLAQKEGETWKESSSQIVVTSSIAAFNKAAPGGWAYGASKAAATHVGKQLAVLLPRWGIR